MAVLHLDNNNFNETINNGKVVLVDFWASWCGPCKMIAPVIEEIEKEINQKAIIGKINVDEEPDLSKQYGIMSIPSLFIFKEGKVVDKMIGLPSSDAKSSILKLIEKNL